MIKSYDAITDTLRLIELLKLGNMKSKKDQIIPTDKWEFNDKVTQVFDDMLQRSIPDYLNMRDLVSKLIVKYAKKEGPVLDLGCSSGGAIKDALLRTPSEINFIGVEISKPMRTAAIKNLENFILKKRVKIIDCDLRKDLPETKNSVVVSVLTIQFLPIEYRQKLILDVYNSLNSNGVFIFVEKILGVDALGNSLLEDLYYKMKGDHGYSQEQIAQKRKSLEGVLVPVTSEWNEEFLMQAGFTSIQKFWQQLNFAGWVAFKS